MSSINQFIFFSLFVNITNQFFLLSPFPLRWPLLLLLLLFPAWPLLRSTAGGTGKCLRTDTLPRRFHERGTRHEDQPDGGEGAGERTIMMEIKMIKILIGIMDAMRILNGGRTSVMVILVHDDNDNSYYNDIKNINDG